MSEEKKIVMYDSEEAASFKRVEGWVSRDGLFFGNDERLARYSGSTHRKCDACGTVNPTTSYCRVCRDKRMTEKFAAYPVEKWDGTTPLCLFDTDQYFFGEDVLDYLADHPEEVRICKCRPGYLGIVEEDNWSDDLPEDGELPYQVQAALEVLNKAIKDSDPVCWWEDKIAIDVEDLRSRLNRNIANGGSL